MSSVQERDEMRVALERCTKRSMELGGEIGDLRHSLVMARSMLRSLVNGWQSNMTAAVGCDSLVWEARGLLDQLDGLEHP